MSVGESTSGQRLFGLLRILFGLIWALNTWFQANSTYINDLFLKSFNAGIRGQPEWVADYTRSVVGAIQVLGASRVAVATVVLDALLALSLISGIGLRFFAWLGIAYNLFMWSTVGGMGGPYTQGATDPGTAIVYALSFYFIIITRSWEGLSLARARQEASGSGRLYASGRILFGLLFAFDAFLKWQPYFLMHGASYLIESQKGQPAWIVSYIQFFVDIIRATGPLAFGLFAAVAESLIALGLLFKRGLSFMLPLGFIYMFGLWTTAEGWGGPYGQGFTGNKGDILGTAVIYCFIFLCLMAMYPPSSKNDVKAR